MYRLLLACAGLGVLTTETSLRIAPAIVQEIVADYARDSTTERAYCLYGAVDATAIWVHGFVAADVRVANNNDVELAQACGDFPMPMDDVRYLGTLHTHHSAHAVANPAASVLMLRPEQQGIACSHFVVLPSGTVSTIPTNDFVAFSKDSTAILSAIFCGDRLVWIDRSNREHTLRATRG